MAIEGGSLGIRVNTICPAFTRTELAEMSFAEADHGKFKRGRTAWVEDIMAAITYLASHDTALATGTSRW